MRNRHHRLDDTTVDRLTAGRIAPDDAPPGYAGVAELLQRAGSGFRPVPDDASPAALARLVTVPSSRRKPMLARRIPLRATAVAGLVALSATAAAAATGSLPDPAQDGLANAAAHVGISLPASHDNHPTKDKHPGDGPTGVTTPSTNHGQIVSDTARNTDTTGRDKGATISDVAHDGHGQTPLTPSSVSPVAVPSTGGIGTGSTASSGADGVGAQNAAPPAVAGSGNATDHPTGRP